MKLSFVYDISMDIVQKFNSIKLSKFISLNTVTTIFNSFYCHNIRISLVINHYFKIIIPYFRES